MQQHTNNAERSEESLLRYKEQRAREKYHGNGPDGFNAQEFKKSVDYLRSIAGNATFTSEDLEDMARAAQLTELNTEMSSNASDLS